MAVCTFFGHRECWGLEPERLRTTIEELIGIGVDTFYVGNQGQFDGMVRSVLRKLSLEYPQIRYAVALAYLPTEKREGEDHSDTIYPEGMEDGPPKFAITRRNKWMLDVSDYCICYIHHTWGGAYQFVRKAKHKGKTVINLCNLEIV